ncbi:MULTISPECIES: LacI family DNA-binding transcriptional regulator [unclassified Streptomyces]|uniref:LacI family DNA-binding transcriptional regulator n=1 Tax=unclassified Streptomyces TaxID=2593676 RepID=UPI0013692E16|nr:MULTISPECIES: LacI family DNA-binding transcriptional regulator [unclassified Streptomyces]MCW5250274.1 LacI family DNA-binding transcriptional regulator [Streptomyces sp. SHP 1-2]MYU25287.1 substrate-binding domain-containing protein [Streptomyces sp. SID8352]
MVQIPKTPAPAFPAPTVPTSADVARLAGVSRATVSYVLNNTGTVRISEATRHRVREAARELGYVPHAAARSLRAGHSRIVLMPAPSFPAGPLFTGFLAELQRALGRLEYTVVQYGAVGLSGDDAVRAWAELRPVAVLVPGTDLTPQGVDLLKRSGARAVVTVGSGPVDGAHALLLDHGTIGRRAGRHLYERGRRRIGVVVPADPGLRVFSEPRLEGVRRAVRGTAATVTELPLAYDEEAAARLAARWELLGLDAVFTYNDEYAMLLMRALQDEGVDVPGHTALIGADDLMLGRLLRPRLSTVRLELPSGRDLAALVERAVHDPGAPPERHTALGATVVHRESS